MSSPLERKHLELAQSILGRKCIIGFTDNFNDSVSTCTWNNEEVFFDAVVDIFILF